MLRETKPMSNSYPPPPHSPDSESSSDGSDTERHYETSQQKHSRHVSSQSDPTSRGRYYGVPASQSSEMSAVSSTAPSPEQRASRPLDVSNMLNPSEDRSSKRKADDADLDTPKRISTNPQHAPVARSLPQSPIDRQHAAKGGNIPYGGTFPRNIKQVVPPSSKLPDGMLPRIDPGHTPYTSAATPPRISTALPSPASAGIPQPGGFPFPPINTQHAHQHPRDAPPPPSGANSPTTSPYSRAHAQPHMGSFGQSSPTYQIHPAFEGAGQGGQGPFMMLATNEGSYPVHVDMNAASKIADEKRKRNAGASARFRQRRKEREREMSTRILELESRIKKYEEEVEHWRNLAMRYAGTPLPASAVGIPNVPATTMPRTNNHGLVLSPGTMARARQQQHLGNEPPYTSPAYPHGREEALGSPAVDLSRTLSGEGRAGRAYSISHGYPHGPHHAPMHPEGHERAMEQYHPRSRTGSLQHPRPQPIPEHMSGRDIIKSEWNR